MKRILPLLILALGVVISSAFGARLGDQHNRYRTADGVVSMAEDDAARNAAVEARDAIGLPTPGQRVAEWFAAGGIGWLLGSGLILVGAVIARRQIAAEHSGEGADGAGRVDFAGAVEAALATIADLEGKLADLPMDTDHAEARWAIDQLNDEKLGPVVDARGQLMARHGLAAFAEYFGPFSAGERNLARVWSAITDGHAEEARSSLGAAKAAFEAAASLFEAAEAG